MNWNKLSEVQPEKDGSYPNKLYLCYVPDAPGSMYTAEATFFPKHNYVFYVWVEDVKRGWVFATPDERVRTNITHWIKMDDPEDISSLKQDRRGISE